MYLLFTSYTLFTYIRIWFNYDLLSNPFHLHHTQIQMAEVAVNGGGISGGNNGGEERWGYGLGLAKEDESGLAVSLNSISTIIVFLHLNSQLSTILPY